MYEQKRHSNISAFTLLEILIAMMIFVLGSVGIWSLLVAAIENHKQALSDEQIAFLASSLVAELQEVDLAQGKNLVPIYNATSKLFPRYKFDIVFTDLEQDAVLIRLVIHYLRYGSKREEIFYTILPRHFSGKK